jgi:F-type H+-transporting ATPase subunit beta
MEVAQHRGQHGAHGRHASDRRTGARLCHRHARRHRPVGQETLGHVFNVLGVALDAPELQFDERWPIHRDAPPFDEPSQRRSVRDRHQVIDLLAPYVQGGKIGMFGGAGVGKTVIARR